MNGPLRIVVLGLSLSSSWGNGHATTWRALIKALSRQGHQVLFLERDMPWYAEHRDLENPEYCRLEFYDGVSSLGRHRTHIAAADAVIVGSYVPDGSAVIDLILPWVKGTRAFYDIDTPVTLAELRRGTCFYLEARQIPSFDLYLSFTGGPSLRMLEQRFGAAMARALYCSVDDAAYTPLDVAKRWDLGYLGTFSPDRQPVLDRLLVEVARRRPELSFVVAGPQYPPTIAWPANVERLHHVPPTDHAAFYASCRATLNVTRADMVTAGHSPSVRLFEAAACGTPIISDAWAGLDTIFEPGRDIIVAGSTGDVIGALERPEAEMCAIGRAGRARVLAAHTASHRARELIRSIGAARQAGCVSRPHPAQGEPTATA